MAYDESASGKKFANDYADFLGSDARRMFFTELPLAQGSKVGYTMRRGEIVLDFEVRFNDGGVYGFTVTTSGKSQKVSGSGVLNYRNKKASALEAMFKAINREAKGLL